MSRYERELNDRPLASLEYIAPEVLAPEMAQAFLSAVQKKQIKSGAGACLCPTIKTGNIEISNYLSLLIKNNER